MTRKTVRLAALCVLGVLSLAVLCQLTLVFWAQQSEAEQLMEILAAGDAADAAWAFEKLKDLSYDDLENLLPYLESERPTPLENMDAFFEGPVFFNGGTESSSKPFELSRVAQFVLSTRLNEDIELSDPGQGLVSRWRKELERFLTSHSVKECAWPGEPRGFSLRIPRVVPPSKDPAMAHIARAHDVEGLLAVLKGETRAQAMWALEVLKRLPDDRLDLLLPHLGATEMVPVSSLYCKYLTSGASVSVTCPRGCPLGSIACFLLWTRLAHPDPAVWTERVSPGAVEEIRAAWLARRASKTLEAGPR